ncbi:FHA domain-containing protein [Geitlerinema sp. PCC 9228]|uniref:FHA domain-containing protein n=1 Tax=Geitlerinema sp. PCC 9228 TaxID=111611 RepID=UPI0008F9A6E7|nr:FHA domain-containing protein [Geitlerinema sp. PCC 9228]
MIVCPNCNHQNPDWAIQCEACLSELPQMVSCPSCGATVQSDASFCGQCGYDLSGNQNQNTETEESEAAAEASPQIPTPTVAPPEVEETSEVGAETGSQTPTPAPTPAPAATPQATQLQTQQASLLHVQTDTTIELPAHLPVIHVGKPNDRIPPDIDLSGFPNAEVVSRSHIDIRQEGDAFYVEDVGSTNGTYINNLPLQPGNRHRLRSGDRIALGKGDLVTFLFQLA